MAKFTDAVRNTLQGYFDAGDQPSEAQFDALILAIQEGIEEHDHSGTGDGDGTGALVGPITLSTATPQIKMEGATTDAYIENWSRNVAFMANAYYDGAWHQDEAGQFAAKFMVEAQPVATSRLFYVSTGSDADPPVFTDLLSLLHNGNFGLGTQAPDALGHLNKAVAAGNDNLLLRLQNPITAGDVRVGIAFAINAQTGANWDGFAIQAINDGVSTGDLGFYSVIDNTLTLQMYIDSSVGVGINVIPDYMLDVLDNRSESYVAEFRNDGNNQDRWGISVMAGADDGSGTTYFFRAMDNDGDLTGVLQTIAGVFQLTDASDEALKFDIVDTSLVGLDIINGLKVRDFKWKKRPKGPGTTGFVAQEALEVYPQMVGPFDDGTLGTSRGMLIPILTKAIQELDARLTQGGL